MNVHRRIKDFRLTRNMTHQQFADAVGVTRGAVQQWEKENGTAPNRARQPAVAKYMGITVDELMADSAVALSDSVNVKQNPTLAHVQQAQAATINVAMSAECQVVCNMLSRLPSDKIDAAMTGIIAAIAQARDSPSKQSMPEESATTKTRSAA